MPRLSNRPEYVEDTDALGLGRPDHEPKATESVPEIVAMIDELVAGGHAYAAGGDVYFRVSSFSDYGRLSGRHGDDEAMHNPSEEAEADELKEDPRDFALWKAHKEGEDTSWESPWGRGRPGWHIECSAMAERWLGPVFEIHGGGVDLVFPHHENEIAQSRSLGHGFAQLWMHNGMLRLAGEKMSKSLGNVLSLREALDRWGRETLLVYFLGGHWRKPLDFSEEALEQAAAQAESFRNVFRLEGPESNSGSDPGSGWQRFEAARGRRPRPAQARARSERRGGDERPPGRDGAGRAFSLRRRARARHRAGAAPRRARLRHRPAQPRRGDPLRRRRGRKRRDPSGAQLGARDADRRARLGRRRRAPAGRGRQEPGALPRRDQGAAALGLGRGRRRRDDDVGCRPLRWCRLRARRGGEGPAPARPPHLRRRRPDTARRGSGVAERQRRSRASPLRGEAPAWLSPRSTSSTATTCSTLGRSTSRASSSTAWPASWRCAAHAEWSSSTASARSGRTGRSRCGTRRTPTHCSNGSPPSTARPRSSAWFRPMRPCAEPPARRCRSGAPRPSSATWRSPSMARRAGTE